MLFFLLSCAPEEPEVTGARLLSDYNSAICDVMTQSECGVELANCGSSVVVFPTREACMDARTNLSEACENLAVNFLNAQETVESCVEILEAVALNCDESDICPEEISILQEGPCAEIQDIFKQCG